MTRIIIASQDANLVADLRGILNELGDIDVRESSGEGDELVELVGRTQPEIVFAHEDVGLRTIRDITAHHPGTSVLEIAEPRTQAKLVRALESGARGVVGYPFAYEDVAQQIDNASGWSDAMRSVLEGAAVSTGRRGALLAVVGAKGGVGTTTLATHLALNALAENPESRVCLIDADVEKGDVSGILDVRQSVSVATVARVADDMTARTVGDALVRHESGLHLLLAPVDVREAEDVTPEAMRAILDLLRREFDLVVVDGGGHITPTQAAVLELAEHRLVVTTPDVLAVRAMRRRMQGWEKLGVVEEAECAVVVNRVSKGSIFPASSVGQLTVARVLGANFPDAPRALEPAMNDRDPRSVTEQAWWKLVRQVRLDLGLGGRQQSPRREAPRQEPAQKPSKGKQRRGLLGRKKGSEGPTAEASEPATGAEDRQAVSESPAEVSTGERGAIALENAMMIPLVVILGLICWQIALIAATFIFSGHASAEAAREYAISHDVGRAGHVAVESVPEAFDQVSVTQSDPDEIAVTMRIPNSFDKLPGVPDTLTTTRSVVEEPA